MSIEERGDGRLPKDLIAALRNENRDLKAQLHIRFEEIAKLSHMLRDREVQLSAQEEKIKAQEGQLLQMKSSLSWKALSVIRWFYGGKASLRRQIRDIRASGLFDEAWYYKTYPDIAAAGVDGIEHYVKHGAAEGRDPSPHFQTRRYEMDHRHQLATGLNPLAHYIRGRR